MKPFLFKKYYYGWAAKYITQTEKINETDFYCFCLTNFIFIAYI
jgi:hypothetical protein